MINLLSKFKREKVQREDVLRLSNGELAVANVGETEKSSWVVALLLLNNDGKYITVDAKRCHKVGRISDIQSEEKHETILDHDVTYRIFEETGALLSLTVRKDSVLLASFKLQWLFDYTEDFALGKILKIIGIS